MEFYPVTQLPKKTFGWFGVAVVPRNHSGSDDKDKTVSLETDNSWREKFGFTKAWLNNGEWFEPDPYGSRSRNITRFVTHWCELPKVPILTEIHTHPQNWRLNERMTRDELIELANEIKKDYKLKNRFVDGFIAAFHSMGIK